MPNKTKSKKISSGRTLRGTVSIIVAVLLIGFVSYLGVRTLTSSSALTAGQAALSITPATGSYATGDTIPVVVNVTSGTTSVTAVRAYITYPASQLELVSIVNSSSLPTVQREIKTSGTIDLIRGAGGGNPGVTGTNTVVTVNFKVIGSGSAAIAFTASSEAYDASGSGNNILNISDSTNATFTLTGGASGTSVSLYRLANWKTKERLFTTDYNEVQAIRDKNGWVYENVAMKVYPDSASGRVAVYRMANWKTKERLFTTDYNEVQTIRDKNGWVFENTAFYASTNTANTAVYRMANFITKERLFTTDINERNAIRDKNGWVYENIAFYAAP